MKLQHLLCIFKNQRGGGGGGGEGGGKGGEGACL